MKLVFENPETGGEFLLTVDEKSFDRDFFRRDRARKYLTIAWNRGAAQTVTIDEIEYHFPADSILPLMVNQSFRFANPERVAAWQFNRDFYCIVDNDREISCVGFLFYGFADAMFLRLGEKEERKIELLLEVFKEEFQDADNIQSEMLRILLVRLIIIITRLAKAQYLDQTALPANKFNVVRQFHLMVENFYRTAHGVGFYAARLNKSPKTLSNYFALTGSRSPLQIIQERIALEAKRLFYYTDKSSKEIAYELGFDDAAHFSRFFKNQTGQSPSEFKKVVGDRG